jgi:heptosyltransferase-1
VPVVLWGPGEEGLAGEVISGSGGAAVLAPRTTVADVIALSRASALVISGDTGPLHLAAAAGAPTVSLFGPTDPVRNGPFRDEDVAVSRYEACGCHYDRQCHEREWCLGGISTAEVCAAVQRRIGARSGRG